MNKKLMPCPFCGSEEIKALEIIARKNHVVYCRDCGGCTKESFRTMDDAIKAWNKRIMSPGVIEGLEKLADRIVGVADCCEDCPAYKCGLEKADDRKCKNAIAKTLARAAGWNV